jgi:hypothetical protein
LQFTCQPKISILSLRYLPSKIYSFWFSARL